MAAAAGRRCAVKAARFLKAVRWQKYRELRELIALATGNFAAFSCRLRELLMTHGALVVAGSHCDLPSPARVVKLAVT